MTRNILFIADTASQLRPAYILARQFQQEADYKIVGHIVRGKTAPSAEQLAEARIDCPIRCDSIDSLFDSILDFDAVIVFLPGSGLLDFHARMQELLIRKRPSRRPILVTGYNGVVYEKHLEGLLWRTGYDVIAVNSAADACRFDEHLRVLGIPSDMLVRSGLLLSVAADRAPLVAYGQGKLDILFATQAVVPRGRAERVYLLSRLVEFAHAFPERRVIIKPRSRPGERTFHVEKHHYEDLYRETFARPPANLVFGYGALSHFLQRVGLVVTVSSTGVMEGIAHGVPGAVLTDLGIKESLGNHFFLGSGMLHSFDDLMRGAVSPPEVEWMTRHGLGGDGNSASAVIRRVERFLEMQASRATALELSPPFYTWTRARFVHDSRVPLPARQRPGGGNGSAPRDSTEHRTAWNSLARKAKKLRRTPRRFLVDAVLNRMGRPR